MKTTTLIKQTTKALLVLTFLSFTFSSCSEQTENKERKCYLVCTNGSGLNYGSSIVKCDSFQMQGSTKAFAWIDGIKMQVEAQNVIYPNVEN